MKRNVEHNPSEGNFGIRLDDEYAYLWYSRKQGALSLDRVFVPASQRGKGVAEALTQAAFQYCQKNDRKVIPVCPYITDKFLPDHAEWKHLVLEDTGPDKGDDFLRL